MFPTPFPVEGTVESYAKVKLPGGFGAAERTDKQGSGLRVTVIPSKSFIYNPFVHYKHFVSVKPALIVLSAVTPNGNELS